MILWSFEELLGVPPVWQVVLKSGCPRTWLPTLPSWDSATSQAPGCWWQWGQGEGNKLSMLLVMREQNPYFCRFPWYFAAVSLRLPSISSRAMLRWVAEMLLIRGKKNIINMWHSRNNYAVIFFFYSLKTINSTFKDVSCLHNSCQSNPWSLTYIF